MGNKGFYLPHPYSVEGEKEKKIYLSYPDLLNAGCKNCIWKLNNQCPYGFTENEFLTKEKWEEHHKITNRSHSRVDAPRSYILDGVCPEFTQWLISLAGETGSSSVLWENYHLFISRLQSHEEYKEFKTLEKEIAMLEKEGEYSSDKLEALNMKKTSAKIWWSRITDSLLKSLGKAADRELGKKDMLQVDHKISLTQIHQIMNEEKND